MAADEEKVIGEESALERDIERVKKASKEESEDPKPKKPESQDDDDDEVEFEDEGDDGDIPSEPTRKEKKKARYRDMMEDRERLARANEQLMANQQALMQQFLAAQQPREPVQQEEPFEKQYRSAELALVRFRQDFSRRANEYAQAGQQMPETELMEYIDRQRELEWNKQTVMSRRYIEANNLIQQQPDPRQQQAQMELAVLRAQYADVTQNQQAALYTDYAYKRLRAEGKPDTIETARLAFEEARKTVLKKTPSAPRPTEAQRSRYTGQPNGAAPAARGGEEGGPKVVKMTKEMRRMADAAFSHIKDDKKRWKAWYEAQDAAGRRSKMTGA